MYNLSLKHFLVSAFIYNTIMYLRSNIFHKKKKIKLRMKNETYFTLKSIILRIIQ